jgi:hypothetical protein
MPDLAIDEYTLEIADRAGNSPTRKGPGEGNRRSTLSMY